MLTKKMFAKLFVAVALFAAIAGGSGVVADGLGFEVTPKAHACSGSSQGGGGC